MVPAASEQLGFASGQAARRRPHQSSTGREVGPQRGVGPQRRRSRTGTAVVNTKFEERGEELLDTWEIQENQENHKQT